MSPSNHRKLLKLFVGLSLSYVSVFLCYKRIIAFFKKKDCLKLNIEYISLKTFRSIPFQYARTLSPLPYPRMLFCYKNNIFRKFILL